MLQINRLQDKDGSRKLCETELLRLRQEIVLLGELQQREAEVRGRGHVDAEVQQAVIFEQCQNLMQSKSGPFSANIRLISNNRRQSLEL